MSFSTALSRLGTYRARNGWWATIRRAGVAAKRKLFANRTALFYCDLQTQNLLAGLPNNCKVERKQGMAQLGGADFEAITSVWNRELAQRNVRERFGKGASLWLIRCGDGLAGYGWTLRGTTVEPHYFPLGADDVHLFDFHVFEEYRGRQMNPSLVTYILSVLAEEKCRRAFIEAAEWNRAQLSSLGRTPFVCLGYASKSILLGRTVVCWTSHRADAIDQVRGSVQHPGPATLR